MDQNYFFIDGSALLAQIKTLWKNDSAFNWRRLKPIELIRFLGLSLPELGSAQYKRAVFYFPTGEQNLDSLLLMPSLTKPGLVRDVHFEHCGEKLPKSAAYESWLESVPEQWKDHCVKSEKGVDIKICCDAMRLASMGKMDRLFLFTNDRDFIPLCRTLKDFGVNVSLVHLSSHTRPNARLLDECDSYDLLPAYYLDHVFEKKGAAILEASGIENTNPEGDTTSEPVVVRAKTIDNGIASMDIEK